VTSPDELRERVADAIATADERGAVGDYLRFADVVMAVVTPELERRDAEASRYKAAHESTQRGLVRMEVQRDEARTELETIRGELADFAQESVPSHVSTLQAVQWLIGEHREQLEHNEELCDDSRALADERDTLSWLHAEAVWRLRGMARRVGEMRRSQSGWAERAHQRQRDLHHALHTGEPMPHRQDDTVWIELVAEAGRLRSWVDRFRAGMRTVTEERDSLRAQLDSVRAVVGDFRLRAEQTITTFGEEGQHDDECDSPAECHASAQHFTWKLAARALEKALTNESSISPPVSAPAIPERKPLEGLTGRDRWVEFAAIRCASVDSKEWDAIPPDAREVYRDYARVVAMALPPHIGGQLWEYVETRSPWTQAASGVDLPEVQAAPDEDRWCTAQIFPSWAHSWVKCGSKVMPDGRCGRYGHEQDKEAGR
jgi:hypothetical protein